MTLWPSLTLGPTVEGGCRRLGALFVHVAAWAAQTDVRLARSAQLRLAWWAFVVIVAALAYGRHLDSVSFWRDEVASVEIARRPLTLLLRTLGTVDAVHGFYYLVLHVWMLPLDSEVWIRALSTVFAVITVLVVAELARRRLGVLPATGAASLLVGSPFFAGLAREARGYTLGAALVAITAFCLLGAVTPLSSRRLFATGLSSVATTYANLFALLAVAGLVLGYVLHSRKRPSLELTITIGAVLSAVAPLAGLAANQSANQSWIARPTFLDLTTAARLLVGSRLTFFATCAILLVSAAQLVRDRARHRGALLRLHDRSALQLAVPAAFGAAAVPGILLTTSWLGKPIYVSRYLVVAVPLVALAVMAAVQLERNVAVLSLVVITLGAAGTLSPLPSRIEDLRGAAGYVAARSATSDCIVYDPVIARPGLDYYLRSGPAPGAQLLDVAVAVGGQSADAAANLYGMQGDEEHVRTALQACPRVWLAKYPDQSFAPVPNVGASAFAAVSRQYSEVSSATRDFGDLRVTLWTQAVEYA